MEERHSSSRSSMSKEEGQGNGEREGVPEPTGSRVRVAITTATTTATTTTTTTATALTPRQTNPPDAETSANLHGPSDTYSHGSPLRHMTSTEQLVSTSTPMRALPSFPTSPLSSSNSSIASASNVRQQSPLQPQRSFSATPTDHPSELEEERHHSSHSQHQHLRSKAHHARGHYQHQSPLAMHSRSAGNLSNLSTSSTPPRQSHHRAPKNGSTTGGGDDDDEGEEGEEDSELLDTLRHQRKMELQGETGSGRAHQRSLTRDPSESERSHDEEIHHRRRTVSDAAQWLRAKRQRDLHRELLPASAKGARQHSLVHMSSSSSRFCSVCFKLLWGIQRPCRCIECGMELHRGCESQAPSCLGADGCIASFDPPSLFDLSTQSIHLIRLCIASADGLARRSVFKSPDPFALVHIDKERFSTSVARKTFSPTWMTERDVYLSTASIIRVLLFDSRRFEEGKWEGFLGAAIIPASAFIDESSLGEGATKVLTFRLRKRKQEDVVTGTICVKVRILRKNTDASSVPTSALISKRPTSPLPEQGPSASEVLLSTSPGLGWQTFLPKPRTAAPNLLPLQPQPPHVAESESGKALVVSWAREKGMTYTLGVYAGDRRACDILYSGTDTSHEIVGFPPGQELRFVVKQTNFFGSSPYSLPSDPFPFPQNANEDDDDDSEDGRIHCPFFMAGFCPRGASCPLYHGRGLTGTDITAAMAAVSMIQDEDVQLFAAMQASLAQTRAVEYEEHNQTRLQRAFHAKFAQLKSKLVAGRPKCELVVLRADLFRSAMFEITRRQPKELIAQQYFFRFHNEGGLDYGGLAREFFYLISAEVFDPSLGMFEYCSSTNYTLQIAPASATLDDHAIFFRFVGRLLGLAVRSGNYLDASLTKGFYKQLLGIPLTMEDLQDVDEDVHRSMIWVLENEVTEDMAMTFEVDYESFGEVKSHALIPNGDKVLVNEDNKSDFVKRLVDWKLCNASEKQMRALMSGFYELIPLDHLRDFTPSELEFLIVGTQQYNLEDWKNHTEYKGFKETDDVISWLWEIIEDSSSSEQAEFLQFCTGSTRVPVEGFQSLQGSDGPRRFCVAEVEGLERLPSAHTCFNRLEMPRFPSKKMLKDRLHQAMSGAQGFTDE